MMADMVVAAEDAQIGHPGLRGLGTSRTGVIWPLVIGMRKAKELYYTGDSISGVQAVELGWANEAYPADENGYCWDYKHFIPQCMVEPRGEGGELQDACAEISGFVRDTAIVTNPLTGYDFCWARVETIGGDVACVVTAMGVVGFRRARREPTARRLPNGAVWAGVAVLAAIVAVHVLRVVIDPAGRAC